MSKLRVLYIVHGHPSIRAGGAEQVAFELFEGMKKSDLVDPFLLARNGEQSLPPVPGALFRSIGDDGRQVLLFTEGMDYFFHSQRGKTLFTTHLRDFLRALQPDVVHFQHTMHIGIDAIRVVRNELPGAAIVVTLHEYLYICNAGGLMMEPHTKRPCERASVARCHACFPDIEPRDFLLREMFLKSHLRLVDRFVAPSHFLAGRFREWGLPAEKLVYIDHGRTPREPLPPRPLAPNEHRSHFGFFGQVNPFKGVLELLEAFRQLGQRPGAFSQLFLNGANLDWQSPEFRAELQARIDLCEGAIRDLGSYRHGDLASRMALVDWVVIPSIWWENSPLVIQEAFLHGRPVICGDIGGMAEKVKHDVNGLQVRTGDVGSIAATLWRAANEPGLWDRLRAGLPRVPAIDEAVAAHVALYEDVLGRRRAFTPSTVEGATTHAG